jgi:glyoxylase-like metal-dependent hydrolase (beta-lactamase superfamily II)
VRLVEVQPQLEKHGGTMEILPDVHWVDGVNANVYFVIDGEITVVDTGLPRNADKIINYVRKIGQQPSNISTIVLTHCHIDHVGSAQKLKLLTNAKVAVHKDDSEFVSGEKPQPGPKGGMKILFKALSPFLNFTPVRPDIILEENSRIGKLVIIHTLGHTPGSIALHDQERKILFVGDTLRFNEGKLVGPPERFTADPAQAKASIRKISNLNFDTLLSGHGDPLRPDAQQKVKEFSGSLQ